jgi:hypothetical protein
MSFLAPDLEIEIKSFAGFMDSAEEDSVARGGSPDAKNTMLFNLQMEGEEGVRATIRRRKGCRLLNPAAIASKKSIDGATWFQRESGADQLIVVCNGAAYVWDGATTFTALTNGGGFTVGNRVTFATFKNNLLIMDGVQQKRYDGTACFDIGADAPVNAVGLAVAAGPGVTGTYEGFWVGYDPVTDHETSPSPFAAPVVFANQKRQWTRPAHTLPANYTKWRVYCRRVDTFENNFFRSGEDVIGTAVITESVSDTARVNIGPAVNSNDKPPVFAIAEEFKGYRLGFAVDSSDMYVSKQLDFESQNAKDKFPVGGRGDTKPVRSVKKIGKECLIQKPRRAYRLVGDALPFTIEPITDSLGGVSQKSGVEVDGWWYQWDEVRGPYRVDLGFSQWQTLGDTTIATTLASVNRLAITSIEVVHYRTLNIVLWAIPTGVSTRRRTLLPFNYKLGVWLPPITGFEFSALTEFTTAGGLYGVYFGDEWGRVYELFSGEVDGVPSGTTSATITACTAGTITAGAAAFYTTGDALAGMPVLVVSPTGRLQWVRAESNTGTVITLDIINGPVLAPIPAPANGTWLVIVGGIDWYWRTPRFTGGKPHIEKKRGWLVVQGWSTASANELTIDMYLNRSTAAEKRITMTFDSAGLAWGSGIWGSSVWGESGSRSARKHRIVRNFFDVSFRFSNYLPNAPMQIVYLNVSADWLPRRRARSV